MDIVDIQNDHMKKRCYFMYAMCALSAYNWYNYSLFDPLNNSVLTPYYANGLLGLYYFGWDTYHMTLSNNRHLLYRTDLMIHHAFAFTLGASIININSLQVSHYMIMECISIMNHVWRNNPQYLKIYRTICVCLLRMPLSLWFLLYYVPRFQDPILKQTLTRNHYLYIKYFFYSPIFFFLYDLLILWKLHKPKKIKQ